MRVVVVIDRNLRKAARAHFTATVTAKHLSCKATGASIHKTNDLSRDIPDSKGQDAASAYAAAFQ